MGGGGPNLGAMIGMLGGCGFAAFVLLVVFVAIVFGARHAREQTAKWQGWASQRGLQFSGSHPMIQVAGTLNGLGVQLITHRYVTRSRRRNHVHYRNEAIATPLMNIGDLTLSRQGFFAEVGRVFGGQDIITGDPTFDAAFVVRSANEHAARQVLTPAVRAALLEARRVLGDVHVEAGGVRCMRQGSPSPEGMDHTFQVLATVARTFGT